MEPSHARTSAAPSAPVRDGGRAASTDPRSRGGRRKQKRRLTLKVLDPPHRAFSLRPENYDPMPLPPQKRSREARARLLACVCEIAAARGSCSSSRSEAAHRPRSQTPWPEPPCRDRMRDGLGDLSTAFASPLQECLDWVDTFRNFIDAAEVPLVRVSGAFHLFWAEATSFRSSTNRPYSRSRSSSSRRRRR